ncbi:MAG: thiosulfate oxidation carrier protein SoxY [Betaproteobacteria bacterium]|nr:thiosulfate oxidation carrier protein SoxY [Betaproteobacteria bacterium]
MNKLRRNVLRLAGSAGALSAAAISGLIAGRHAWAANRNEAAFQAKAVADALKNLGAGNLVESRDIVITAPDIAENGAVVPVAVTSRIANTESIAILAEKNPFPLAASFDITPGADAYVSTRIKMGQTSDVRAIVKAGGKYFTAVKEVKVTIGGCG